MLIVLYYIYKFRQHKSRNFHNKLRGNSLEKRNGSADPTAKQEGLLEISAELRCSDVRSFMWCSKNLTKTYSSSAKHSLCLYILLHFKCSKNFPIILTFLPPPESYPPAHLGGNRGSLHHCYEQWIINWLTRGAIHCKYFCIESSMCEGPSLLNDTLKL